MEFICLYIITLASIIYILKTINSYFAGVIAKKRFIKNTKIFVELVKGIENDKANKKKKR